MVVAVEGRSLAQPAGRRSPAWTIVGALVLVLAVAFIGLSWWVGTYPPVADGSVVAALGEVRMCDATSFGGDASLDCYEVPFREGERLGIGFSVRNDAPIPMTILSVESVGVPLTAPAVLEPELPQTDGLYGLDVGRPFEPIEVAPGQEGWIQLVGTYTDCERAARYHPPGSAMVVDHARMTLRWALFESTIDMPLRAALSVPGPLDCPSVSG